MKRQVVLGLATATVVLLSAMAYLMMVSQQQLPSTATLNVSWARSYDLASLSREAELIVRGVVVDATVLAEGNLPFTFHTVRVERVIKGTPPVDSSQTIIVLQTGGQMDGARLEVSDDPLMKPGDTLILFLEPYRQGVAHRFGAGVFVPLGGPQGRFYLQSGRVYAVGELHPRADLVTQHLKTGGAAEAQFISEIQFLMGQP